jgi:Domain of unknown function (DUF4440)
MEDDAKANPAHHFTRWACVILILCSFSAVTVAQSTSRVSQPEAIAGVKAAEEALRQSQLKYDTAVAKAILADEFIGTWNHGERVDKRQFLSLIADQADPLEVLEYTEMEVRVYGEAAVVWSLIHEKAIYGGKLDEYRGRRTAVWVKRNMRWQCVTIQTSAFDQGTLPAK